MLYGGCAATHFVTAAWGVTFEMKNLHAGIAQMRRPENKQESPHATHRIKLTGRKDIYRSRRCKMFALKRLLAHPPERPAPAKKLPCRGRIGNARAFARLFEFTPSPNKTRHPLGGMVFYRKGDLLPPLVSLTGGMCSCIVPGGFDEKAAYMGISRLSDTSRHCVLSAGVLGGDKACPRGYGRCRGEAGKDAYLRDDRHRSHRLYSLHLF